ncbi:hypothetical protein Lepto7375DRAFT_0368 [Leptolyngbya sp. PCC 7375]|nr:hypothetical protein Lepto7375DRAFT_0368 [Leptolyngbya sp. PCC 7375]
MVDHLPMPVSDVIRELPLWELDKAIMKEPSNELSRSSAV